MKCHNCRICRSPRGRAQHNKNLSEEHLCVAFDSAKSVAGLAGPSQVQSATVEGAKEPTSERQSLDEGDRTYSDTVELAQRSGTLRRRGARSLSMEKNTPGTEGWSREQVTPHPTWLIQQRGHSLQVLPIIRFRPL